MIPWEDIRVRASYESWVYISWMCRYSLQPTCCTSLLLKGENHSRSIVLSLIKNAFPKTCYGSCDSHVNNSDIRNQMFNFTAVYSYVSVINTNSDESSWTDFYWIIEKCSLITALFHNELRLNWMNDTASYWLKLALLDFLHVHIATVM